MFPACVLKSECLVDTTTVLCLLRGLSWLHCVEYVDTKINRWQLSNFIDWKCERSRSFGVISGNLASSWSSFSLYFFLALLILFMQRKQIRIMENTWTELLKKMSVQFLVWNRQIWIQLGSAKHSNTNNYIFGMRGITTNHFDFFSFVL